MHESSSIKEFLGSLKEQLFRTGEKERLKSMSHHAQEREVSTHADMLSMAHDSPKTSTRQQQSEHHGLRFWTYYFEDEHPDLEQPLPEYLDKAWDEKLNLTAHTLEPALTRVVPEIDRVGETEREIERRWLREFTLGQAAFSENDFVEAERKYRAALEQAECLRVKRTRKLALAASGLAESLKLQNKLEDADKYFAIALCIDEELLGDGETSVEDEFYNIAHHFVLEEKYRDVEELLADLADRLKLSVGRSDPLLARCMNELGVVYTTEGKFEEAEPYFLKALQILERTNPPLVKQLAAVHSNYASLCDARGRADEAHDHYNRALEYLNSRDASCS